MTAFARYPSLLDRPVLITGGATGIGMTLVQAFADQGARVGFIDIDVPSAESLVAQLGGARHVPVFVAADLTDIDALDAAIAAVRARIGPIAVLLNNAANDQRHSIDATTSASWDAGIAVNLKHQFFAAQAVRPQMRDSGGGSIINFGSITWLVGDPDCIAYVTAKSAINGLTRGLARELGPERIRVNSVMPGWIMTRRQVELWLTPAGEKQIEERQCLRDRLYPPDVARMVLFLAADDSRMCTAQNYIVDGGWV